MITIPDLHVGHGIKLGPVTMFPVWADAAVMDGVSTGTTAHVDVIEMPGGAEVQRLTVTNRGSGQALLLEGELLEGGMQTRTLAYDLLIAAGASAVVDVACVERRRWHGSASHDRRSRRVSASVQQRLRDAEAGRRQQEVWASVARYERASGPTASESYADHLDRLPGNNVGVHAMQGQTGVIVGIGGWPVSLELFGSPSALSAHLAGILDAARLDAILAADGESEPVPGRRARRFATAMAGLHLESLPVRAGVGSAVTGGTAELAARGLATPEGILAHASVLNLRHKLVGAAG